MAYPVRASRMTISVGDMALSFLRGPGLRFRVRLAGDLTVARGSSIPRQSDFKARLCRSDSRRDVDVEAEHVARVPGPLDGAEPGESGFVEGQASVGGVTVRDGGEVVQHPS